MKKIYQAPEAHIVEVEPYVILAGSQFMDDTDVQELELEDEVLDGDGLLVY